ncbi:uncharacterized protein NPIL_634161, partial [Nephila pilipes]
MVRVMTYVLRFQPKAKDFRQYTELTNEELLNAQKIIFRVVQKECYSNEETRKHLRGLQVFEDEEGILRLKSRLINEEESKYFISPIILPSKHLADIPLNNASDLDQIEKTNIVLRWSYIQKVREILKQRFKREYLGFLRSSVTKREDKINSTKIKSEARELVESFPITNENYPLAIESLTERYGRKELLIDFYVRELLKLVLNNATKKKQDSLSSLYNKLSTQLRALSSLGVTTDQCGVILYPLVESSLPTHILRSFERQRKNIDSEQSISTLDAIVSFLKSEVQSEEKIKLSRSEILPYERECKHLAESQSTLPSAAELFIQESRDTCAFCFKVHANRFCKRAFFIPLEEKIAIIKKKGLCRVCLAKGHLASRCRSQITCQLCSKRHLKFMCPNIACNKSDSPKQEVNDKNINEETVDSLHSRATNEVILQTLVVNVHGIKKA